MIAPEITDVAEKDIRDAFFDEIYRLAAADRDIVFLTDDMDAFSLRLFRRDFPDRFVNVGVAEQNMINVAAGLATCGKRVFAYGIASFVTMRCFEQIKLNVCSMNLPVTLVGVGAGFSFGFDGPTHHGTQDIAIMRALPELSIFNPADSRSAVGCARVAYAAARPAYVRLDKGTFAALYDSGDTFESGFKMLRPLAAVNLVSTGLMTHRALDVADLLSERGIKVGVVDVYRLKPVDDSFVRIVLGASDRVVTLEEHSIVGGLGTLVAELVVDAGLATRVTRLATRDEQFSAFGGREWFLRLNGLDREMLARVVVERT